MFLATGMLPLKDALGYIDWNVLMMIAGTMGIVSLFIESRMPARMADILLAHVPNVKWAVVMLACLRDSSPPLWTMWRRC